MGNRGARLAGLKEAPVTVQDSVEGVAREVSIVNLLKMYLTGLVDRKGNKREMPWGVPLIQRGTGPLVAKLSNEKYFT
jgi:hypothetical protein